METIKINGMNLKAWQGAEDCGSVIKIDMSNKARSSYIGDKLLIDKSDYIELGLLKSNFKFTTQNYAQVSKYDTTLHKLVADNCKGLLSSGEEVRFVSMKANRINIHHINGDKNDNRSINLIALPISLHASIHKGKCPSLCKLIEELKSANPRVVYYEFMFTDTEKYRC